jgi:hypothetical protein
MIIEFTLRRFLVFLAIILAPLSGWATEVPLRKPGLPNVLTFHLEDGRHRTPGLTLSFALPGVFEYECREIVFREERREREIRIELLGVELAKDYGFCRIAKEPAPIEERIVLPTEPGNYQIVFVTGERHDRYELVVRPEAVELEAKGSPTFTSSNELGRLMRIGWRWLWVDFWFITDDSFRRIGAKRDEVLADLVAIGAKPFAPPPGRYLLDGFVRQVPSEPQSNSFKEEYFFQWDGDWLELQKVASRYRKYSTIATKRPVMEMWLSGRDNVISISDGRVYTFILEKAPPAVQPRR